MVPCLMCESSCEQLYYYCNFTTVSFVSNIFSDRNNARNTVEARTAFIFWHRYVRIIVYVLQIDSSIDSYVKNKTSVIVVYNETT